MPTPPQRGLQIDRKAASGHIEGANEIQTARSGSSFQFIDVTKDTPEHKSRNRTIARSHVMRNVRKELKKREAARGSGQPGSKRQIPWQESIIDLLQSTSRVKSGKTVLPPGYDLYCETFAATMMKNASMGMGSWIAALEAEAGKLPLSTEHFTPMASKMMQHYLSVIWPLHYPAASTNGPSPIASEWWRMIRQSPVLFHASTHAAAVHLDSLRKSSELSNSTEALTHKAEAIRLIKQAISEMQRSGGKPDNALLMSVLAMSSTLNGQVIYQQPGSSPHYCPFKPLVMQIQFQKQFAKLQDDPTHKEGLFMLLQLKGGIEGVDSPVVSMAIEHHALLSAMLELKHPRVVWHEISDIAAREADHTINVPMVPPVEGRGLAFPALADRGLSPELLLVLSDLQEITLVIEAYTQGTLQNPDILSIASRRNRTVHALLSVPTMDELTWNELDQSAVYESCRLAAIVYTTATIFPLPTSTGVIFRIAGHMVSLVDQLGSEVLYGRAAKTFLWAIFLCGTGSEAFPQRPWFVRKLKTLFASTGIGRWTELKTVLSSHLWLDSAMDEPGFNLFEDVQDMQIE